MIIGENVQANSKNQFPSQKKISEVPRRVFSQRRLFKRLAQERHLQRIPEDVVKYFVPAVIFIAISAGVGWYFVGVTGATFSVTGVTFSLLSFFS
jgi:hypothetical protein